MKEKTKTEPDRGTVDGEKHEREDRKEEGCSDHECKSWEELKYPAKVEFSLIRILGGL